MAQDYVNLRRIKRSYANPQLGRQSGVYLLSLRAVDDASCNADVNTNLWVHGHPRVWHVPAFELGVHRPTCLRGNQQDVGSEDHQRCVAGEEIRGSSAVQLIRRSRCASCHPADAGLLTRPSS